MPSAIINRRVWGGVERIQGTASWTADCAVIRGESSPLNVGLGASYEPVTHLLTVDIEVYFTADVTDPLTIFTMITEDGIIATQSGGTSPYTHNHVFRAALPQPSPAQWGEPLSGATTAGSLLTLSYTFDNSTANYDMNQCEVVVFVRNAGNEEIISGNGAGVTIATGMNEPVAEASGIRSIYPNPVKDVAWVSFYSKQQEDVSYTLTDNYGKLLATEYLGSHPAGVHRIAIPAGNLSKGIYHVNLYSGNSVSSLRFIR